ncbi:hypothetical protein ABK040_006438 [Willaertia magna]
MSKLAKIGETAWSKIDKTNSELLAMTYGSLVTQMLKDYEDVATVNAQLEKMGYKMGMRMVDEFMAKSGLTSGACREFKDTAESISKVGFKMFLGINATIGNWNKDQTEYSIYFDENPLNDFVELPENIKKQRFYYSNILCGVIRGSLEMVLMRIECEFKKCPLLGDDQSEIRVKLKEYLRETVPNDE